MVDDVRGDEAPAVEYGSDKEVLKDIVSPAEGDDNPQEAAAPLAVVDFSVTVHDESNSFADDDGLREVQTSTTPASSARIVRKRRRKIRQRRISNRKPRAGIELPAYQYECELVRRSTRKPEESVDTEESLLDDNGLEIYGDTSLGMKLSVIQGQVIVQNLNPLDDGRASPAQLSLIRRGDVILAINEVTLASLPIDQLMQGLAPLSTPDENGDFERNLNLRMASQQGLPLLLESEAKAASTLSRPQQDDLLSFLMVDQLSGQPMYPEQPQLSESKLNVSMKSNQTVLLKTEVQPLVDKPLVHLISDSVAEVTRLDRQTFESAFFEMNEQFPTTLRAPNPPEPADNYDDTLSESSDDEVDNELATSERAILGRRALRGAKALSLSAERVDRGDDVRSFRSWNTNLSLYSRASTRRRYVLDADTALPVHFDTVVEEENDDIDEGGSGDNSSANSDGTPLETDELLLRLAAHDDIWRKQVVEFLKRSNDDSDTPEKHAESSLSALGDFGALLFGESATRALKPHKKTQALPQEEITAVLFDLTTKISTTIPDEITAVGSLVSFRTRMVPFTGMKRPPPGSDGILAFRFLVDEALPVWLGSFKPLPWEYRRVLWPLDSSVASTDMNTGASTLSDELTADSFSVSASFQHTPAKTKKNLREVIEDQEMNPESRAETCFLATFYFTQGLLPDMMRKRVALGSENVDLTEVKDFIVKFGAYLRMHTCLAYLGVLKAQDVIHELLQVAKFDPRHEQARKQMSQNKSLTVYEPTILSAVVEQLNVFFENGRTHERKLAIIDWCTLAYPDVRPWQVRRVCLKTNADDLELSSATYFYEYLSALLHPVDGHDSARNDKVLVKEWCEMSAVDRKDQKRWDNFMFVASRSSSHHLAYYRDLRFLLSLASQSREDSLVFDLSHEILEDPTLSKDPAMIEQILSYLRESAVASLDAKDGRNFSKHTLKRILRLYQKMSLSSSPVVSKSINVPSQLASLLTHRRKKASSSDSVVELLHFFGEEAAPGDLLEAVVNTEGMQLGGNVFSILQTCLSRAAQNSARRELSGSLLKLRNGRRFVDDSSPAADEQPRENVWAQMSKGELSLDK